MSTVVNPTAVDRPVARPVGAPPATLARPRLRRIRAGLALALTAVALAGTWWYVAPPQLGGSTSVVTIDGTSMLPTLRRSDLVALRPQSTYGIGDIVGYRSLLIHRVVLHRIVAIRNGRYVFKGDNNSFIDPDRPTRSQLVGRLWLHVPSAGRLVLQLHRPPVAAALAILLVLAAGLGGGTKRRRTS